MTDELVSHQQRAQKLYADGNYQAALDEYTVLRKLRASADGKDSLSYLSNLHSSIYCLNHLQQWDEAFELARELSTTRDRILGKEDSASIDAKRWWIWMCTKTGDLARASDLEIEIADVLYSTGDTKGAERAVATAVFYQGRSRDSSADQAASAVTQAAATTTNAAKIRSVIKKAAPQVFMAGVVATFEGIVGGIFD